MSHAVSAGKLLAVVISNPSFSLNGSITSWLWYLPSQSALQTYIVYHSLGTYLKPEVSSMAM